MSAIPVVTVEEHHEAFYVWNRAVRAGEMAPTGNTLLHVDEHSDMSVPRLRRPLGSIGGLEDLARFTYDELDIGNFIWPAVYQGLFNRVLWMRHEHRNAGGWRPMQICAKNEAATEFVTGSKLAGTPWEHATDRRPMEFVPVTTADEIRIDQPIVLDVDLDYFCSNEYPDYRGRRLEVTAAAYDDFLSNPYHFLRLAPGSKVTAAREESRFYLLFNDQPEAPPATSDAAGIEERVAAFERYLRERDVRPFLIVLCRSVHSGYMPPEQLALIEERLNEALLRLYPVRPLTIAELLPKGGGAWQLIADA
jgi:hypothetical protein